MRLFFNSLSGNINNKPLNSIVDPNDANAVNAPNKQDIPTPYNPKEVVHPGVWVFDSAWNGYTHWLAVTPYPNTNDDFENPCIFGSNDGDIWVVPNGLTNPIDEPTSGELAQGQHMSDTDLFFEDGTMYCIYRFKQPNGSHNVYCKSSTDGVNWGARTLLLNDVNSNIFLSPSIIKDNNTYYMYVHTYGLGGPNTPQFARVESNTIDGTYGNLTMCNVPNLPSGRDMWHSQVKKPGTQYHCLMNTTNDGTSIGGRLLFMVSDDGLNWTSADSSFLQPSASGWDNGTLYRGCMWPKYDVNNDIYYDSWYSSTDSSGDWWMGRTTINF